LSIAGIFNLEVAALVDNLLGREGPLGVPPSWLAPPPLDFLNLFGEKLVLHVGIDGKIDHVTGSHGGLWDIEN